MQRAGTHKVLGRGRSVLAPCLAPRARGLTGPRAGADVNRYAALRPRVLSAFMIALCILWLVPTYSAEPLDAGAVLLAKVAKSQVRGFSTRDFGREPYKGARSALVKEADAPAMLAELRRQLPIGLIAFIGTSNSLVDPPAKGVELVVASGKDQFEILRIAASDAANYDMTTEDLIKELRSWDREFGISITQAETDTIILDLKSLPLDLTSFATRVYKFCPDIVDQGVGDIPSLVREIRKSKKVFLWWD